MAGYREHISVSGTLGICYGVAAVYGFGFTPVQGALAGCLAWVAGMLPDLDSDSGKPIREMFSLAAAIAPLVLMQNLLRWTGNAETALLAAVIIYATIRYGLSSLLARVSVHRGMFHSIPALLIAAECGFLAYQSPTLDVRLLMAGGVGLGFLSHLLLDELYSVEWSGLALKLKSSAGSAVKLFGKNHMANLFTYGLLALLTYLTCLEAGILEQLHWNGVPLPMRQAVEDAPIIR